MVLASFAGLSPTFRQLASQAQAAPGDTSSRSFSPTSKSVKSDWVQRLAISTSIRDGRIIATKEVGKMVNGDWQPLTDSLPFGGGEVTYRYKFEYDPYNDSNYHGRVIFTPEWYDDSGRKYSADDMRGQRTKNERYEFYQALPKITDLNSDGSTGCGSVDFAKGFATGDYNQGQIKGFSEENGWERIDPNDNFVAADRNFRTGGWAIRADPTKLSPPYAGDKSPAYLYCTTNITETTTSTLTVENMVYTAIETNRDFFTGKYQEFFGDQSYVEALNGQWMWTGTGGQVATVKNGNYPLQVPLTVPVKDEPLPARDSRISVTKTPDKQTVMQGGEEVAYTYEVTNNIPERFGDRGRMYYQNISDDKCPRVGNVSGLTNDGYGNYYIPAGGVAVFSCTMNVTLATTNTVTAVFKNNSDGQQSQAAASATVRVRNPNLPFPSNRIKLNIDIEPAVVNPGDEVTIYYTVNSLLDETLDSDRNLMKYYEVKGEQLCNGKPLTLVDSKNAQQRGKDPTGTYIGPGGYLKYSCTYKVPDSQAGLRVEEVGEAIFDNEHDNQRSTSKAVASFNVRTIMPEPAKRMDIVKFPLPKYLPYGGGHIAYDYYFYNLIPSDYTDVPLGKMYIDELSDDKCSPLVYVEGPKHFEEVNGVQKQFLLPGESLKYRCETDITQTTTNTATMKATNAGDNRQTVFTKKATAEVAANPDYPDFTRWASFDVSPSETVLPDGGGDVNYTYTLTNLIPKNTNKPPEYSRLYLDKMQDVYCDGAAEDLKSKLHVDTQGLQPNGLKLYLDAGETVVFTCKMRVNKYTYGYPNVKKYPNVLLRNIDPEQRVFAFLQEEASVTVLPPMPAPEKRISVTKSAVEPNDGPGDGDKTTNGRVYFDDEVAYTVKVKNEIPAGFADRPEGKMHLVEVSDPICTLKADSLMHRDFDGQYLAPGEEASWICTKKITDEKTENTANAQFKQVTSGEISSAKSNTVTITAEERPVPGRIDCSSIVTGSDVVWKNNTSTSGQIGAIKNLNAEKKTFDTEILAQALPNFFYTDQYYGRRNLKGGTAALAVNPRSSNEVFYSIRNGASGYVNNEIPHNGIFKFDNATKQNTQMVTWSETKSMVRLGFDANYTLWSIDDQANIQSYKFNVDQDGKTIPDGREIKQHGLFKLPKGHGNFKDKGSGDLAFDGMGNMWVITSEQGGGSGVGELYVVPASELEGDDGATAVFVGKMGNHEYVGMAFDEEGNLWASDSRKQSGFWDNSSHLYLVDTATGKASDVGEIGANIHDLGSCALPKPELRINKEADPSGGPIPGEEITYRITIENIGNLHAIDMKFQDLMPQGATYIPGSMRMTVSKLDALGNPSRTESQWQYMPDNPDGTTYFHTEKSIKSPSASNPGVIDYKKASEEKAPPPIIIEFKVKPDYPQKATTNKEVCNQAKTSFVGNKALMSDDPTKPGLADKSCTRVIQPNVGIDKYSGTFNDQGDRVNTVAVNKVGKQVDYDYVVSTNPIQPKFNNNSPSDQPKGLPEETRFNKKLETANGEGADKLPTSAAGIDPKFLADGFPAEYWQKLEGTEPLKDVVVTDDKCVDDNGNSAVYGVTEKVPDLDENGNTKIDPQTNEPLYREVNIGDVNNDGLLDFGEKWKYSCKAKIKRPTENIAMVTAKGNRSNQLVNDTDKWFIDSPQFKIQKLAAATQGAGKVAWKKIGDSIRPDDHGKGTAVYQTKVTNVSNITGSADTVIDVPKPPEGVKIIGLKTRFWYQEGETRKNLDTQLQASEDGKYVFSIPELKPAESFEMEILVDYQITNMATVDWDMLQTCQSASDNKPSSGLFNKVEMIGDEDGPENNEACIPIEPPNVAMQVHKFARNCDADQATCDLQGAEFVIYDSKPTAGGTFKEVCVANPDTSSGQPTQVCSFFDNTVEADGKRITGSIFKSVPLEYNKSYWLLERQAPAGFTLLPRPIEFRITPDNPDTPEDESGVKLWNGDRPADNPLGKEGDLLTVTDFSEKVPKVNEQGEPVLDEAGKQILEEKVSKGVQLNIENTSAKAVLPKSGSRGFYPYLAAGVALLIAAGLILNKDKLKKRFKR